MEASDIIDRLGLIALPADARISARERAWLTERSMLVSGALVVVMGILLMTQAIGRVREERREQLIESLIPEYLDTIGVRTSVRTWQLDELDGADDIALTIVLNATRQLSEVESDGLRSRPSTELRSRVHLIISVFRAGFNWKVVEQKWPGIGDAFHGSAAKYFAHYPATDLVGLLGDMRKRAAYLGGTTAQDFLREMGKDSFILSRDVLAALKREQEFDRSPSSKASMEAIQKAFNHCVQDGGESLTRVSRVLAFPVG